MKTILRKIIHPFFKSYYNWSQKKPRVYRYKEVYTLVQPTVFSPKFTISTKIFLNYISEEFSKGTIKNKKALELGCGSGIISLFCASQGLVVTASDINKVALESLDKVSKKQQLTVKTVYSDLFKNIKKTDFDYIFINPPYYPKKPKNTEEEAWFCGENFEYFESLFQQLPQYVNQNNVLMILSDDCKLDKIKNLALENKLILKTILEKKMTTEVNYIFKIIRKNEKTH